MNRVILFDLSEVLIAGLLGVEQALASRLDAHPETVLTAMGGDLLHRLCRGELTEDQYLTRIITNEGWKISDSEIKQMIRRNFHRRVAGMDQVLNDLARGNELFLLSDHAREWVEYIRGIHPFLSIFQKQFYSFELGQTKQKPSTFIMALRQIQREPQDCLLIDDNQGNIASAASISIDGIQFKNTEQLIRVLTERRIL